MLAEFGVQVGHEFAERFPVPGHHLGEKQCDDGRVAFRQVEA